jgi:hypothetical protein
MLWLGPSQNLNKKKKATKNKATKTLPNNLIHNNKVQSHLLMKAKKRKHMFDLLKKISTYEGHILHMKKSSQ